MKKYKVAIAGCGGMANEWVKYALSRDDVEITALADIKEASAIAMAENHKLTCGIYSDIREAIQSTGANLVFDITVPESHKDIVIPAFELGCDVLGEKPMASSFDEAKEMVAASKKYGRFYAVMQNRRYLKKIRAFRELIKSGTIGQPGFICADFFVGPHFGGFRDLMESPLVLDMAIHTFDQARFISGADPVSVYCHEFNPAGSWYKGNAAAICIFEFSDGSVFCYRGSWCAEGMPTSWEASWRVTGSKGTAVWDGVNNSYCEVAVQKDEPVFFREVQKIEAVDSWGGSEGHSGCFDEMFTALSEGRKAETDCGDNIKSVAMVFGAIKSAREGKKVNIL